MLRGPALRSTSATLMIRSIATYWSAVTIPRHARSRSAYVVILAYGVSTPAALAIPWPWKRSRRC